MKYDKINQVYIRNIYIRKVAWIIYSENLYNLYNKFIQYKLKKFHKCFQFLYSTRGVRVMIIDKYVCFNTFERFRLLPL